MKLSTHITKFSLICIFLLTILVPFVYAANQSMEVSSSSGDDTTASDMSVIDNSTAVPSLNISTPIYTKKKLVVKKEVTLVEKVRIGYIQTIDNDSMQITLLVGATEFVIDNNSATMVFFGNEEAASFDTLDSGMRVYVFGYIDEASSTKMSATKIVIANKSLLRRK